MKLLLLTLLTLFTLTTYAQKPLRFKSNNLISNGSTVIKLNNTGGLGEVMHHGKKIIQGSTVEITKSGKTVKGIDFGKSEYKLLGQTLEITNAFEFKKTPMKLTTLVTIHGHGLIFDQSLEAKKGYELKSSQIQFESTTYEGDFYEIGSVKKRLMTRDEAISEWNAFQADMPSMFMTIGSDPTTASSIYFREMSGSFGIVLADVNEWFNDYIVKIIPQKPGKISYYVALPKEGKAVAEMTQKSNNSQAKAASSKRDLSFNVVNPKTIKNERSLIKMKDSGLMEDVVHEEETLIKGLTPIFKKDGKVINIPFSVTKNSKIEGNKLVIQNDFKYQGEEFQLITTAISGKGYVDFVYEVKSSPSIEFVGATIFLAYENYKNGTFKLDNAGFKYKTKEEVTEDWNYLIWSRPSTTFTASTEEVTALKVDFSEQEQGKMEMVLMKEGYFKDYMLKIYQSEINKPLKFRLTLPKALAK